MSHLWNVEARWQQTEINFVTVLNRLHTQEDRSARDGHPGASDDTSVLAKHCTANCPSHRQTAKEQYAGVDCTQRLIQKLASKCPNFWMEAAIHSIGAEHPAEEQHFCNEEQPDSEFTGVKLLFGIIEMVRQPCWMIMVVIMTMIIMSMGMIVSCI
jgi:hypothetical protein